jgi:hypothetical protein
MSAFQGFTSASPPEADLLGGPAVPLHLTRLGHSIGYGVPGVGYNIDHHLVKGRTEMRAANRLPDFSVIVWLRMTERFNSLRSDLLSIAPDEPYEMNQYQGMADFHWGFEDLAAALELADALSHIAQAPEVVLLYLMSRVDEVESLSLKDQRTTEH